MHELHALKVNHEMSFVSDKFSTVYSQNSFNNIDSKWIHEVRREYGIFFQFGEDTGKVYENILA